LGSTGQKNHMNFTRAVTGVPALLTSGVKPECWPSPQATIHMPTRVGRACIKHRGKEQVMKKRTIGACIAAVCLAGVLGAAAGAAPAPSTEQGIGLGLGGEQQGPLARLMSGQLGRLLTLRSEVNLTTDQKQKIAVIVKSHKAEIAAAAQPIVEKRRALRDAVNAKTPDEKAIRAASEELGKAIGGAAVLGSKIKAEVRAVLTPEQLQKIEEFRKNSDQTVDQFIQDLAKP